MKNFNLSKEEILDIFKEQNALKEGHFLLTSGRHSNRYLQCALVLQNPVVAKKLCGHLVKKLPSQKIDVVIGPALGGVTLAYEVARQLDALALFAEREDGVMTLRRGFSIEKGTKVLVVEDVITTGGSIKEVIKLMEEKGAEIVGTASLVDRSNGKVDLGYPLYSILPMEVVSYPADECPLCKEGLPLVKPGSRKLKV
ncbi:MAG: orotate phosphoribosyltransferase [Clostridia bacterium]|nr:orotate phosphoribosyltransferase [Clostridia bacterium]